MSLLIVPELEERFFPDLSRVGKKATLVSFVHIEFVQSSI